LQDAFAKEVGEPFGLVRGIRGSNADHVPAVDWWAALNAPAAVVSKTDHARAAVGIKVPSIELAAKQSQAFEVQRINSKKLRQRAVIVSKDAIDLEAKASYLNGREKLADMRADRLATLEKENLALRAQVAKLAPVAPGQGLDLAGLGLA
jgi:hypothetical protein